MIDKSLVIPKIKEVIDPEVEINIVDLGLIYSVEVLDDTVNVEMTFTMRGCPLKDYLSNSVKEALFELEGVKEVNVDIVWEPEWTVDRFSFELLEDESMPYCSNLRAL